MGEQSADERIKRAFMAAFMRFCSADSIADQEDELSNMLHHFSRLVERRGKPARFARTPEEFGHAAALTLYRNKDTHDAVEVSAFADVFGDYMTNLVGAMLWAPPAEITEDSRFERYDASFLTGKLALETLRTAFDAVYAAEWPDQALDS